MDGTLVGVGSHNSIWPKLGEDIKIVNKIYPTFIEHTNTKCTYRVQALDKFVKIDISKNKPYVLWTYNPTQKWKCNKIKTSKTIRLGFFFIIGSWRRWQTILITIYTCGENRRLITKFCWLWPLYSNFPLVIL